MQQTRFGLLAVLAIVHLALMNSSAIGQTRPSQRVAQRSGGDQQPAASDQRAKAAPRTAGERAAPANGSRAETAPAQRLPNGPVAPGKAVQQGPQAPFVLTEAEQQLLDQILLKWEKQSDKVKTFKCDFRRYEYNPTFGDPKKSYLKSDGEGSIDYKAPDRGAYRITKSQQYNSVKNAYEPETELDRWTCDGLAIYEFDAKKKHVIQRKLPPEMQGKAISDGPLPFVFGAKADQLRQRYWMRDVTPKDKIGEQIWLEARPKFQRDAANFKQATVILNEANFMPFAVKIALPSEDQAAKRTPEDELKEEANIAYVFQNVKVNDPLAVLDILKPSTPIGWKLVVDTSAEPQETPAAAKSAEPAPPQAKRTTAPTQRK